MSEPLAISAANLDIIEQNLGAVADELSGVIENVNEVNDQVKTVEDKVATLNDEVKNLVKEIRETTIITSARQNIMYNNEQIEKKYGYYDKVRRTTESLISAINESNISINALLDLKQDLILNNPNYWLSSALAALTSWLLDDKENCDLELKNALSKDEEKTSLFFSLINLKLGRVDTSINWLNKYLSIQNPLDLNMDFVTVLDLVATGSFGDEEKAIVLNKIDTWFNRLINEKTIQNNQLDYWHTYVLDNEDTNIIMPYLEIHSKDINLLKKNLSITSSYKNILNNLKDITTLEYSNKSIDEIISNLIYEYEKREEIFKKDNFRNNLIIECNGNREEAEKLYKKQESIYANKKDLITLLTNIVIYKDQYKVSNETKKLAISYIKPYLIKAINNRNNEIYNDYFNIKIDKFTTKTIDGTNNNELTQDILMFLENEYKDTDKGLIIGLLIANFIGIICITLTFNYFSLCIAIIMILMIADILLLIKLRNRTKLRENSKRIAKKIISETLEKIQAETIDYRNMMKEDQKYYDELMVYLNNINTDSYIKSNNERNVKIGD